MTSECLTTLGVEMALNDHTPPHPRHELNKLAQMGRFDDAFAVGVHLQKVRAPNEDIEAGVHRRLASYRITAAIRKGESLKIAVENTPLADQTSIFISALDLLERNPYAVSAERQSTPGEQALTVVKDMAAMIAAMEEEDVKNIDVYALENAAELEAALGNRAMVIQLLEKIPDADRTPNLSEDVIRVIGPATALQYYDKLGGNNPRILLRAASVEAVSERRARYLARAYDEFSKERRGPNFDSMEEVVHLSTKLGHPVLALKLARDLASKVRTTPLVLPVFLHLKATRSLMTAEAEESEISASLAPVENSFPKVKEEIVAFGSFGRPILWKKSGLDAQARVEVAKIRAKLGEVEAAIEVMDGVSSPVFAWRDLLSPAIPIEQLNALVDAAGAVLPKEDHAYVRAQLAEKMSRAGKSRLQKSWALSTAKDVLQAGGLDGKRAVTAYVSLAKTAARLKDHETERLALEEMGQAALSTRRYGDLIRAGFQWHQSELTP